MDQSAERTAVSLEKVGWATRFRLDNLRLPKPNRWQVLGVLLIIVVWEGFAWYVHFENPRRADRMFPRIEHIVTSSFPEFATYYGFEQGLLGFRSDAWLAFLVLMDNALVTVRRVVIGIVGGVGLGVGVGLLIGWSRWARDIVLPPVLLLRTIPILALIPLFMFWFGAQEIGILIYITFAIFAMMIVNTLEAIRNVPTINQDYARCMGATRWQVYRTVVMPAIVPSLAGGIRVIIGISWAIALAGELLATDSGLGWLMILSERFLMTGRMVVIVVIFVIFSLVLNLLFLRFSGFLTRWMPRA
jgi:ABC-type nitrate/sulfonate/bicarbonate transport system permease component